MILPAWPLQPLISGVGPPGANLTLLQYCDEGLIGPRRATIGSDGKWSIEMRAATDCISRNPYHAGCLCDSKPCLTPNKICCRWPYTFQADLRVRVDIIGHARKNM